MQGRQQGDGGCPGVHFMTDFACKYHARPSQLNEFGCMHPPLTGPLLPMTGLAAMPALDALLDAIPDPLHTAPRHV
jgi:hypothetical protein